MDRDVDIGELGAQPGDVGHVSDNALRAGEDCSFERATGGNGRGHFVAAIAGRA